MFRIIFSFHILSWSLRGPVNWHLHARGAAPSCDGWVGGLWYFTLFNFLHTFRVYRWGMYIIIFIVNGCHQDPYGFQNWASNWRVGSWISKLPYNSDFSEIWCQKYALFFQFKHYFRLFWILFSKVCFSKTPYYGDEKKKVQTFFFSKVPYNGDFSEYCCQKCLFQKHPTMVTKIVKKIGF